MPYTYIEATGHGFNADDLIVFSTLEGGTGIIEGDYYYVLAAGLTADAFQFSETMGGTPFEFDDAITAGDVSPAPTWEEASDGVQDPPTVPAAPALPTLGSAEVGGIVRLQVTLAVSDEGPVRSYDLQVTNKYDSDLAEWVWTTATKVTLPAGAEGWSMPALPETIYAVRMRKQDVYGNFSDFCAEQTQTTVAGNDAINSALAAISNGVNGQVIDWDNLLPDAVRETHIQAGSVTANALASVLVLASLIYAGDPSGRHVEIDELGIRLVDSTSEVIVNIPTDPGTPVYFKGDVVAESFTSRDSNDISGTVGVTGSAVMTLANGVQAPTIAPSVAASVDSLTLTGTGLPSSAIGMCYDSGAGTFWIAVDPATGYVAYEYNATTGAFVRRIAATGSTTTTTTTLGSTSHVSDTADGVTGSTNSHFAVPLTMPRDGRITKVSAYLAGRLGSATCRVGIWTDVSGTGNAVATSAAFTASSGGATTLGASDQYNKSLSTPYEASSGQTIYAGFYHSDSSEGIQFDKDDGAGKTTYSGDGTNADGTGWGTYDTAGKPNVYITYEYDTDTRLETAAMIGVATDGTYIYTLDTNGVVWKYDRTTLAHVSHSSVQTAVTGTKSKAGLFYDATAGELLITTTTGTGAGVYPKLVRVNTSTLAVSASVYSAAAGTTFSGTTDTFRGGARLDDPLNASAATYWIATSSAVYAYTFSGSTLTQTSNRDFGTAATMSEGLTHDGTQFRGFDASSLTKIWKFTNWDFTTTSTTLWVGYSWYDSAGTTHETAMGSLRSSLTIRRRERVLVGNAAVVTGGADDPDSVRIYALQNATDTGAGTFWLQTTDSATSRYLTSYTGSGTHDGAGTAFPSGTPAEIKSSATGWSLKGDGSVTIDASIPIGGKPPVVQEYNGVGTTAQTSSTWTKPAGLAYIVVEAVGGGGGGGGGATTGAGESAVGAGGGGGGYVRRIYTAAQLPHSSYTVRAGGGGSAGSSSGGAGGTGGTSDFGMTGNTPTPAGCAASGGGGGGGMAASSGTANSSSGAAGVGSGGQVNARGFEATGGRVVGGTIQAYGVSGGSIWGGGLEPGKTSAGSTGQSYGGGGSGGTLGGSTSGRAGGAGGIGKVVITEYYGA